MTILKNYLLRNRLRLLITLLFALSVLLGILIPFVPVLIRWVIISILVGSILLFICVINYKIGYCITIISGFLIFSLSRISQEAFPVGWIVELFVYTTFIGVLLNSNIYNISIIKPLRHPITLFYMLYMIFLLWEIFNPNYDSYLGWFNFYRRQVMIFLFYIVTVYVAQTDSDINWIFKLWFLLFFFAAMYAILTQWIGMPSFEDEWVRLSKTRKNLYYLIDGFKRKYSLYSDPAAFGMDMSAATIIGLIYFISTNKLTKRIVLILFSSATFLASVYSGTRTSYLMIIVAILLYLLFKGFNRTSFIVSSFLVIAVFIVMYVPIYNNMFINRLRSAFYFNKDASLQVRNINREKIQPYLYDHLIGGGIYTTGGQGEEFNPGHVLAGFPPDSGYLRTALETGIIGFFILLLFHYVILKSGTFEYYKTTSYLSKKFILISTLVIFSFVIANYSQDAFGQIPSCFLFCLCLATIVRSSHTKKILE